MDKLYTKKRSEAGGKGKKNDMPSPSKSTIMFLKQFARTYQSGNRLMN